MHSHAQGRGTPTRHALFIDAADEIRRLLHQFAAGFLKEPTPALIERLAEQELDCRSALEPRRARAEPASRCRGRARSIDAGRSRRSAATASSRGRRARAAEPELSRRRSPSLPRPLGQAAFSTLAPLPAAAADARRCGARRRARRRRRHRRRRRGRRRPVPDLRGRGGRAAAAAGRAPARLGARRPTTAAPRGLLRTLHTLKGSARLAGAMRLGEMAHRMESEIEHLRRTRASTPPTSSRCCTASTRCRRAFDALRAATPAPASRAERWRSDGRCRRRPCRRSAEAAEPSRVELPEPTPAAAPPRRGAGAPRRAPAPPRRRTHRLRALPTPAARPRRRDRAAAASQAVRVRAHLLDRLVNQAGEVMITRSRLEADSASCAARWAT